MDRREFIGASLGAAVATGLQLETAEASSANPIGLEPRLGVYANGRDILVAESLAEAKQILMDQTGFNEEEAEGEGWRRYDDDELLDIRDEDTGEVEIKKAKEWADELGKCLFAWIDN